MPIYHPTDKQLWQGRNDGEAAEVLRWHQIVQPLDISMPIAVAPRTGAIAWLGFASDEGVRRNQGRAGAAAAPHALRRVCAGLPVHKADVALFDAGDYACVAGDLEASQQALASGVATLLHSGYMPMLVGGGHEIAYAHYRGVREAYSEARIGIINIDAHFDMRPLVPAVGASSGTGFWQIAQESAEFHYLVLGIQAMGNTRQLFDIAQSSGAKWVLADDFRPDRLSHLLATIHDFIASVDIVYLTVCLDVFAAPYAPGVSALAYRGIVPDGVFMDCYRAILASPKLKTMDIAELNPQYDTDNRTARLAASLLWEFANR